MNLSDFEELGPAPTKLKPVEAKAILREFVQGLVLQILVLLLYKGQRSVLGSQGLLPPVSCSSRRDISHCSDMGPCPGEANGKQQEAGADTGWKTGSYVSMWLCAVPEVTFHRIMESPEWEDTHRGH